MKQGNNFVAVTTSTQEEIREVLNLLEQGYKIIDATGCSRFIAYILKK